MMKRNVFMLRGEAIWQMRRRLLRYDLFLIPFLVMPTEEPVSQQQTNWMNVALSHWDPEYKRERDCVIIPKTILGHRLNAWKKVEDGLWRSKMFKLEAEIDYFKLKLNKYLDIGTR